MISPDVTDLLYVLSGFSIGVLIGMTGIGGGSLMTPLLILLFGVAPSAAVATDLLFTASTKAIGTLAHGAAHTIDWGLVGLFSIGSVPATVATVVLLSQFDLRGVAAQNVITIVLGLVLLITAVSLLAGQKLRERYAERLARLPGQTISLCTVALGLVVGLVVTATSVGAGAIGVTVLLLLHPKIPASRIVGSDIAHTVPLTLLAGAGHWFLGSTNWSLLCTLLIGSLPGILIGSY